MPSVPVKPYKSKGKSDGPSGTASTSGNETEAEGGGQGGRKEGSPLDLKDVAEAAEHARLFEGVYQVGGGDGVSYVCVLMLL